MPHTSVLQHLRSGRIEALETQFADGSLTPAALGQALALYQAEIVAQALELERGQEVARQARDRFATFFDELPVMAFIVSDDGRIVRANRSTAGAFGLDGVPRLYLRRLGAATADQDRITETLMAAFKSGNEVASDVQLKRVDGVVLHGDLHMHELPSAGADPQVAGVFIDRTEQLRAFQAERDAAEARRQQAIAQARVDQTHALLARVSHELRTPLNAVLGFTQLMQMSPNPSPQMRSQLQMMEQAGQHLVSMVDDILALANPGDGTELMSLGRHALRPIVAGVVGLVEPQVDSQGQRLVLEPGDGDPTVMVDPVRVRQVLLNLLSNAIKYNRTRGTIRLSWRIDGAMAEVAITDEGEGLSDDQQERLFEPFNRLGREHSRIPGTGLGLAIARQLAAAMHGDLTVRSRPGEGSVFLLRLPLAERPL